MFIKEFFNKTNPSLVEGGNLKIGDVEADRIDSKTRPQVIPILDAALNAINNAYKKANNNIPLWMPDLLSKKTFLAGSSFHFFNRAEISDIDFAKVKRNVGDIDTQVDKNMSEQVRGWLKSLPTGATLGPAKYVGMDDKDPSQILTLWQFPDIVIADKKGNKTPITIQIDLELKPFAQGAPTQWAQFSASSSWNDLSQGIKGVFHKFIIRSLSSLTQETFMLRKIGVKKTTEKPTTDNMISFAVKSKEGGGLRNKFEPVIDPKTGEQEIKDNLPVYTELPTSGYKQDISDIFTSIFGDRLPPNQVKSLEPKFWSFIGIVELMKDYLNPNEQQQVANGFLEIVFGKGAQRLYANDQKQDLDEKTIAVTKMYEVLGVQPPANLNQMITDYTAGFKARNAPVTEQDSSPSADQPTVVASARKGVVHLEKMKDLDFLDLLDELQDESGEFSLNNIKMTVKIDGMGGRLGKDANGVPFFETSSSGPIQRAGAFSAFAKEKGFTNPVQIERAQKYDELYNQIMELIPAIDEKYGPDFLKDVKVHCEVLYIPMADEVDDKLKFVSVAYNKFPSGVQLALVPLFVEVASTGESHPNNDNIKDSLVDIGIVGDSMFIDNSITYKGKMNVTGIIKPLENLEGLKSMLLSKKRDQINSAKTAIQPIKNALANEIISNPNIVGKDKLGQDYEGLILYTQKGPVKVTSPKFKEIMAQKASANAGAAATPTKPQDRRKAVVTVGNFVGHKGHQELIQTVLNIATSQGRDPYIYIGQAYGPDDPIPPDARKKTLEMLFPKYANQIQLVDEGSWAKKIEIELSREYVLQNQEPYKDILVVLGSDRATDQGMIGLMKKVEDRLNNPKFPASNGTTIEIVDRAKFGKVTQSIRGTDLRNVLKDNKHYPTYQDKLNFWLSSYDPKLSKKWVEELMNMAANTMKINLQPEPEQIQERLFNSLLKAGKETRLNENAEIKSIQQYLNTKGAKLNVDGILGPKTKAAIQQLLKGDQQFLQTSTGVAVNNTGLPIKSNSKQPVPSTPTAGAAAPVAAPVTPSTPGKEKTIVAVVNAGAGYTDVKTDDGEIQRRQGSRAWRNNNPGNIEFRGGYAKSKGAVGTDGRYAVFPTFDIGFRAKKELLFAPNSKYINLSIHDAMHRYAPNTENDTAKYIQVVTKATGSTPETLVKDLSSSQRDQMLMAINKFEGYKVGQINVINPAAVAEKMLPKSTFTGTGSPTFHNLGSAAHAKGSQKSPVKKGQFVGSTDESKSSKLIPLSEDVQSIMSSLIKQIIQK